jgi:hypothetical protein
MSEPLVDPVDAGPVPAPPERPEPWWLKLTGLLVACVGALMLALVCAFLTPLRIGTVEFPLSLPLVVGGLVVVLRFTHAVTHNVGLTLIPGGVWLMVSLVFSVPTDEGDVVLMQSWVPTLYLLLGSVTIGVVVYRMVLPRHR